MSNIDVKDVHGMNAASLATALLAAAALCLGCTAPSSARPATRWGDPAPATGPYALLLGTAQDGGLPQLGCGEDCCAGPSAAAPRLTSAVLLVDPDSGGRWLLDAGPDLPGHLARAAGHPPGRPTRPGRPPLFEAIAVTHAHLGHMAGLLHLGRESYGAQGQPLLVTAGLAEVLAHNAPWSLLLETGHLAPITVEPGRPQPLRGPGGQPTGLTLTALPVPHRDEFGDTVAYLVQGPRQSLLYLPDIDKWERWERDLGALLDSLDVALLDGTFFADGELPGRPMAQIPHPFISETLALLDELPRRPRARVVFTHLNHSNPAARPDGAAAAQVRAAGCEVAHEGQVFTL